ncbi:MAG: DKNYY domain-containing protein [Saprospiraceae bacterium]
MIFRILIRILKGFLMVTGIMSLVKCSQNIKTVNGKTVFYGKEITDSNFVILNESFAKDNIQAYYKSYLIEGSDPKTFEAINEHYAKDKNAIYYCDEYREGKNYFTTKNRIINVITGAHHDSFKVLDYGFAIDDQKAYFNGNSFKIEDPSTFEVIDFHFCKDQKYAYFNTKPIQGVDGKSFLLLNDHYAQDKDHYFYFGGVGALDPHPQVITDRSLSLELLNYPFSKTQKAVYFETKIIKNLDPASAEVIGSGYIKDNKKVYCEIKEILNADPTSFTIPDQVQAYGDSRFYAIDKNSAYYSFNKIEGVDIQSFELVGLDYSKDKNHVYFRTQKVNKADPKTFEVYNHGAGDEDAKDISNTYKRGVIVGK